MITARSRKRITLVSCLLIISFGSAAAFQTLAQQATTRLSGEDMTRAWNRETLPGKVEMIPWPTRAERIAIYYNPFAKAARKKLEPTNEEKQEYKKFLKTPNSGLFRIASNDSCGDVVTISSSEDKCVNLVLPGKGMAYSFRRAAYTHDAFSDLRRDKDAFVLPGNFVLGMIAFVGDQPIESIAEESGLVKNLLSFVPATDIDNVERQDGDLIPGVKFGNLTFNKSALIREKTTYVLRSVAYRVKLVNVPKGRRSSTSINEDDKRDDVIVVFRVVKTYPDGTLLLLWRELFRERSPQLEVSIAK